MKTDGNTDDAFNLATLTITPEWLALISELDEFKGAWRAIGRIAPERLTSLKRVATIESIGSSTRIEGASLTDRQVEALLRNVSIGSLQSRDEQEVAGYARVMETLFENHAEIELSENHVLQLHRDLLQYSVKDERHRGSYKFAPNHIEAFGADGSSLGVIFTTATPFQTPGRMQQLIAWTRNRLESRALHPLLVIGIFIVALLEIHPFQDGNGRLSRALTTLLLLRAGYSYVSYSSLEQVIEHTRDAYYLALRKTQTTIRTPTPDWQSWLSYFLNALARQKRGLENRMDRESRLLGQLPALSGQIIEIVREHGRVTVASAADVTGASRNTVKDHLKALLERGLLERHGGGRGTWYSRAPA